MAKAVKSKRKNMKARRMLRKTLGTLFLVSAIGVAAIPVEGLQQVAADGSASDVVYESQLTWKKQQWEINPSTGKRGTVIPVVPKSCDTIYTTADGTFQFAFVTKSATDPNYIAIILGYNGGNLAGNRLEIPKTVNAYTKFYENNGSKDGYVAVSRSQKALYYLAGEPELIKEASEEGPAEYSLPVLKPCYTSDVNIWGNNPLENFFYLDDTAVDTDESWDQLLNMEDGSGAIADGVLTGSDTHKYVRTTLQDEQWIKDITVAYIGNQSLTKNTASTGTNGATQEWMIYEEDGKINEVPANGVFANESNIVTLVIPDTLEGIGNYAFYGCTGLNTAQFGNGLTEVGHHAFADCVNMQSVGIQFNSKLTYISDYTFQNCRYLTSFTLPAAVRAIYDHAFDGCSRLGMNNISDFNLSGAGQGEGGGNAAVTLARLGYSVFKNCSGLQQVILPESIEFSADTVNLNNFQGCSSLKHIQVESQNTTFVDSQTDPAIANDTYTVEDFKADVAPTFYFECNGTSATHTYTQANAIAFKYADQDKYEIILREHATTDGIDEKTAELTYQVDSNNALLYFNMNKPVSEVVIPANVGPYGISAINSGSFSGNCLLEKITIPGTVHAINENAFRGCHNLKHVLFANAGAITYIGNGAFATQEVDLHASNCPNSGSYLNSAPTLTFTGTVGTGIVPYDYAMSAAGNINTGAQPKTYITYYSGWPTNLEIQYQADPITGEGAATLVGYPAYAKLKTAGTSSPVYTKSQYPYMTTELENAANEAVTQYEAWLGDKTTQVTEDQWNIIHASLNPVIPAGIKAVSDGLFNGATVTENADGTYDVHRDPGSSGDEYMQSITFEDLNEYTPYMFDGCVKLEAVNVNGGEAVIDDYAFAKKDSTGYSFSSFNMYGGGSTVGDYAFDNNQALSYVKLSASVNSLGLRPFRDCPLLSDVDFSGSPYYQTDKSIIYKLNNGVKDTLVECLEARTGSVTAAETTGVNAIAEEAFMDCNGIGRVDLSDSKIKNISKNSFNGTKSLYSVTLPNGCSSISAGAFDESNIQVIEIPESVSYIDPLAFNTPTNPDDQNSYRPLIEFVCSEDATAARTYADQNSNIEAVDAPSTKTWTVNFWTVDDNDSTVRFCEEQIVADGQTARIPELTPTRTGYRFVKWILTPEGTDIADINMAEIHQDMNFLATFKPVDSSEVKTTVRFLDYDDKVLYTQQVTPGEDAIRPEAPKREGYTFTGWRPAITAIPEVLEGSTYDTYAQYEPANNSGENNGENNGGNNNGGNNNGGNNGGSNNGGGTVTNPTLYTLTVRNGSGSGSYVEGAKAIIIADDPSSGMEFANWTVDSGSVTLPSTAISATVVTMPAGNVTVTANYKKKSTGSSSSNNSVSGGNANSGNNVNTGTVSKGGTTVVIDKNGLSNTGVVSATVNGSSDNFTIKITENTNATEAIVKALIAEYGSDLSNIKYFPMDITLYDSTGKTKITDTTGLSISITLPLPDSLATYAGNNKVAGVVNDKLDKLTPRFTTISGVPCVTFTAEHFSPYVIYVDITNLSASGAADTTPKTGDGIHPKWFLSIGLACVSVVLFLKKDKKRQPVKARA